MYSITKLNSLSVICYINIHNDRCYFITPGWVYWPSDIAGEGCNSVRTSPSWQLYPVSHFVDSINYSLISKSTASSIHNTSNNVLHWIITQPKLLCNSHFWFRIRVTVHNTLREIELQNDHRNGCWVTYHGCWLTLLLFLPLLHSSGGAEKVSISDKCGWCIIIWAAKQLRNYCIEAVCLVYTPLMYVAIGIWHSPISRTTAFTTTLSVSPKSS